MGRRSKLSILLAIFLATHAAGCSDNGDTAATAPPTPPAIPAPPDPAQASRQAAFEEEVEAAHRTAAARLDQIEKSVKAESALDKRLSVIITEYCRIQDEQYSATGGLEFGLGELFEKYWQAGGKWNRPIWSAARQQGGCPALATATPPRAGG